MQGKWNPNGDIQATDPPALKDSGQRQEFSTGSVRDSREGKGRYDLLPMHAIQRLAVIFEKGAAKYGEDNWRRGQPLCRFIDSALRHLCMFAEGNRDEDHAAQALWNVAALIESEEMIRRGLLPSELNDLRDYVGVRNVAVGTMTFSKSTLTRIW